MTFWDYADKHTAMVLVILVCELWSVYIAGRVVVAVVRGSVAKKLGPHVMEKGGNVKVTI